MPSVTLDKSNLLDWLFTNNGGVIINGSLTPSDSGDVGELFISGNGSDSDSETVGASASASVTLNWDIEASGSLDLSSIPADNVITSIDVTAEFILSGAGAGHGDAVSTFAQAAHNAAAAFIHTLIGMRGSVCGMNVPLNGDDFAIQGDDVDTDSTLSTVVASADASDTSGNNLVFSESLVFDPPILKADFDATVGFLTSGTNQVGGSGGVPQPSTARDSNGDAEYTDVSAVLFDWGVTIHFEPVVTEIEVTQSGEIELSGGGSEFFLTNDLVQSGELALSGGGSDFFIARGDISGIYALIPGKTDDTWYNRANPEDVSTTDVKIPDPFVQTAFLGD